VADAIPGALFAILDTMRLHLSEETQGFTVVLETFLREQV
jgi:hypothetical protein